MAGCTNIKSCNRHPFPSIRRPDDRTDTKSCNCQPFPSVWRPDGAARGHQQLKPSSDFRCLAPGCGTAARSKAETVFHFRLSGCKRVTLPRKFSAPRLSSRPISAVVCSIVRQDAVSIRFLLRVRLIFGPDARPSIQYLPQPIRSDKHAWSF